MGRKIGLLYIGLLFTLILLSGCSETIGPSQQRLFQTTELQVTKQKFSEIDEVIVLRVPPAKDIDSRMTWADWHNHGIIKCHGTKGKTQDRYFPENSSIQLWRIIYTDSSTITIWSGNIGENTCSLWLSELDRIPGEAYRILVKKFPDKIEEYYFIRNYPQPKHAEKICKAAALRVDGYCKYWENGAAQLWLNK